MTRPRAVVIAFVLALSVASIVPDVDRAYGTNAVVYDSAGGMSGITAPVTTTVVDSSVPSVSVVAEAAPEPPPPPPTTAPPPPPPPPTSAPIPGIQYPPYSSLIPGSPLVAMIDELVSLEGEWVREPWTCIAWKESQHQQYNNGPTQDHGFVMITDFWWKGGFGRVGRPDLMWADPYDPHNQAQGAHTIWERNGGRWKGQWASNWMCNLQ